MPRITIAQGAADCTHKTWLDSLFITEANSSTGCSSYSCTNSCSQASSYYSSYYSTEHGSNGGSSTGSLRSNGKRAFLLEIKG